MADASSAQSANVSNPAGLQPVQLTAKPADNTGWESQA